MRINHTTKNVVEVSNRRHGVLLTDNDAREDVIVTTKEFRSAVDNQVSAVIQSARVARSRKGAIDAHEAASRLTQIHDSLDVDAS